MTLFLTSCTDGASSSPDQADAEASTDEPVSLTLGMMASSDVIPYVLINELSLHEPLQFELHLEVFVSATDRDAAFQAGELDGVLTDYIGVIMYQNAGFDVRMTGITDGDYILMAGAHTDIASIEELDGQSIAISQNTLIDYSLDRILAETGIAPENVEREIVARIPDRLELLRNGQIDLGLMPEPFATLALNDDAVYLKSANDIGLHPAVSAFSMDAIREKEAAIERLYQAYDQAVDYMNSTPLSEYEALVIEAVRYPEEMLGKIEIKPFRFSKLPDRKAVEEAIDWAEKRGLTDDAPSYDDLIFDVYD